MTRTPQSSSYLQSSQSLTVTALLIALGILIPMVMPVKVIIGPASYTLASHVPIMMAMMIHPITAMVVALGTAIGFLVAGFPVVITLRALSHILFAAIGAYYLQRHPRNLLRPASRTLFSLVINSIHALAEVIVVYLFTASGEGLATDQFFYTLFVLVGIGTLIHGMVDWEISYQFVKLLQTRTRIEVSPLPFTTRQLH